MNKIIIAGKEIGIDFDAILKAKEEGKESFEVQTDLIVRTQDEQNAWFNNSKKESIKTALEMEVKKHKNNLGLEFEGKSFDKLFGALQEKHKTEFSKEPNDQLIIKDKDIETLKQTIQSITSEKEALFNEYTSYKNGIGVRNEIERNLPDNLSIPREDMVVILQNRLSPKIEEGKVLYHVNGDVAKNNTTLDPLSGKEVISSFFKENQSYLKGATGGAGGSDSSLDDGKGDNLQAFNKRMEAEGIKQRSLEYTERMTAEIQAGTLKV